MEPTQAKPVKKRRRWLIVAFVLLLMSLGTWWYWPRGDARFVGTWSMTHTDKTKPYGVVGLYASGGGEFRNADGTNPRSFPWRSDGTTFVMGHGPTGSISAHPGRK